MHIANSERATVHRVDAHEQLAAELDQGDLPPDQQQAVAIVRSRIQTMGPSVQSRVQAALQAIQAATLYGVQRVPAVVFDGSRVVYDVADVTHAIEIVRRGGGQSIATRFIPGTAGTQAPSLSNWSARP
jgi:integrating conjugative element protein (TIGR03757 family)